MNQTVTSKVKFVVIKSEKEKRIGLSKTVRRKENFESDEQKNRHF